MQTTTRNANLDDLMTLLRDQQARKVDVVAPASQLRAVDGRLVIRGADATLTEDGVTVADGTYTPTVVCDEGLADKLGVPVAYLKRLRETRPDLYDANVNGWLHGRRPLMRGVTAHADGSGVPIPTGREPVTLRPGIPADPRAFLVRCFRGDDTGEGIARAFLSDRYARVDNLDVLVTALDGIRDAGVPVDIDGGDLTDRRMVVRVTCPDIAALAPALTRGYRSPFTGQEGADNPTVWAGFVISNSEVGGGAFSLTPRIVIQVCRNGMTIARDALTKVHLGSRMDAGVIRYAADTQEAALTLVKKQSRDAVTTFLSADYLHRVVEQMERNAEEPVGTDDEAVRDVTRPLGVPQAHLDGILDYFRRGGQFNRAGVANALTAYAQGAELDGDTALDLDTAAAALLLSR
jgi:hypothetical protein